MYYGDIFKIDFTNKDVVIEVAKKLASGKSPPQVVFKRGKYYCITFAHNLSKSRYAGVEVVWSSQEIGE